MPAVDRLTRAFWRSTGRSVDLRGTEQWLSAPTHESETIGDAWLGAAARDGALREGRADAGLLADLSQLDGPGFRAAAVRPEIRDFYERTCRWRMEVWTEWSPVFRPGGELVSRLFGRRVQQLAIPTRPLDVAHGMDSRVVPIVDSSGRQRAAAWLRTLRSTGAYVYSGWYSTSLLPGTRQPSVHVAFPLQAGNLQVFLEPSAESDGSLRLSSPGGDFGDNGAYVTVTGGRRVHAVRVPIRESFHLYVDSEHVLRTDHVLRLWSAPVVRLHYKLTSV